MLYNGLLIGKRIEVIAALDKSLIKKSGLIVDESRNLLTVESSSGRVLKLPKSVISLRIADSVESGGLVLEGSKLIGTLDERIKA